jgi:hypothetical protein
MKFCLKQTLTVISVVTGLAGPASAVVISGEDSSGACHVSGFLTVHDDRTQWSLKVTDIKGEGYGAYAKIVVEREGRSDTELHSSKTDDEGDTIAFNGTRKYAGTKSAKLYACVDDRNSDHCSLVEHVKEN